MSAEFVSEPALSAGPAPTRDEQAIRLIIARVLGDLINTASTAERAAVTSGWLVGDRIGAALHGRPAGAVQLRKGSTRATVSDPQALEAWVAVHHPDGIETVTTTRVRPAYQTALLAAAKQAGAAVTPAGEELPGVTVTTGDPTVAVTLAEDAAELVAAAWETGELWELLGGLLPVERPAAVPAPEGSEAP